MENRRIQQNSLEERYYMSKSEKMNILNILKNNNEIELQEETTLLEYLSSLTDEEKIKKVILEIEKYEYIKPYTYSSLYNYNLTNRELVRKMRENKGLFNFKDLDFFSKEIEKPKILIKKNKIQFKFAKVILNDGRKIKYPIIIDFFTDIKIFQIKFEKLELRYQGNENGEIINNVEKIIEKVEKWLIDEFKINFNNNKTFENISKIITQSKLDKLSDKLITESLDYGRDQLTGDIKLRANSNDQMPIYSELEKLRDSMVCEADKEKVQFLIRKIEETVERYKRGIECAWKYGTKKSRIEVAVSKDLLGSGKDLCHMYANTQCIERRDYVIKFIGKFPESTSIKKPS